MEVVEQLTDMAFNEEEDRRKTEHNSNDENNTDDSHFNTSNINADSTSVTQPATQVWVLMPYTNMTDGNSVALPGMKPSTLPFPTELLQQMPFRNLPQLYPFKAVPLPSQQEPSNSTPTTANSTTAEPSQQTQEETVSSIERDEIEVNNNKISSSVSVISNGTSSEKPHTAEQKHQHELQSHLSPSASFTSSMYNKAALPSVAGNPATNTIENTAFEYSRPEEFEDIDADDSQYDDDQFADPDDEEQFADPDDDNKQAAIDNNSNWDQDAKSDNINNWETESKSSNVSNWEQKSKGYYRNWKQDVKANATTRSYIEGN
ncbi:hypothetical protein BDF20DRAFT_49577 [Mycotypha africana]|uniref:uncharacterized protein n=1 Tax=Mycotypha africana TaxID=64632 RepID=UPI002300B8E8|nr:uncharacterized protein BDF20DRAFT_49577 [Mycotypha africana]KAI8991549.1 hypothetical protein BDF20DRAFT_49577 [Mycotypha africana]